MIFIALINKLKFSLPSSSSFIFLLLAISVRNVNFSFGTRKINLSITLKLRNDWLGKGVERAEEEAFLGLKH